MGKRIVNGKVSEKHREKAAKNLDLIFDNYIKKRDSVCPITNARRNVGVSRVFGKEDFPQLRWDEDNAILMLNSTHELYHRGDPFIYLDWYVENKGQEALDALKQKARGVKRNNTMAEIISLSILYLKKTQDIMRGT